MGKFLDDWGGILTALILAGCAVATLARMGILPLILALVLFGVIVSWK